MIAVTCLLSSCLPSVTGEQAISTAYRYTQVRWMPEDRHVLHGPDSKGIVVQTPDHKLPGDARGWWKPGVEARSMPYQWGGFDTPESFLKKIAAGKKAGDIANDQKRQLGDRGTSSDCCGIDCSGLISRCWNLSRPYSTSEMPLICKALSSWDELRTGDILLNEKHVVLFVKWNVPGKELAAYEAGPYPVWRVSACGLDVAKLKQHGYAPWRYQGLVLQNPQP